MTEENEKLKTEVKRLTEQCQALSQDNTALRECVVAAGGKIETEAPALPSGPTEEEKKMAAAAGAKAAAEAMEAAKKAAASCPSYFPRSSSWPYTPTVATVIAPIRR